MNAQLQSPLVEPGSIEVLRTINTVGRCVYFLGSSAHRFTDLALLQYFGFTKYFGGKVERQDDGRASVHVYTD